MTSTIVDTLLSSIKSTVSTTLGNTYSELPFTLDVKKNNFNSNHNRYGVTAGASLQSDSVTKFVTMAHTFNLILSKAYIDNGISDSDQQDQTTAAQDLVYDIYKSLIVTKAGSPSLVINIVDLAVAEPEYLVEEKVIIIRASFNVLYRFTLL